MNQFVDGRGYSLFDVFPLKKGQINLSEINPGIIKAFHRHQKQTDYWMCIEGTVMVNLVDSDGKGRHIFLDSRIPYVLEIPPMTWHGYKAINSKAKMLYYVTEKYDSNKPDEQRIDWDKFGTDIWEVKNQ